MSADRNTPLDQHGSHFRQAHAYGSAEPHHRHLCRLCPFGEIDDYGVTADCARANVDRTAEGNRLR